jgi:hypothetical protein
LTLRTTSDGTGFRPSEPRVSDWLSPGGPASRLAASHLQGPNALTTHVIGPPPLSGARNISNARARVSAFSAGQSLRPRSWSERRVRSRCAGPAAPGGTRDRRRSAPTTSPA